MVTTVQDYASTVCTEHAQADRESGAQPQVAMSDRLESGGKGCCVCLFSSCVGVNPLQYAM